MRSERGSEIERRRPGLAMATFTWGGGASVLRALAALEGLGLQIIAKVGSIVLRSEWMRCGWIWSRGWSILVTR